MKSERTGIVNESEPGLDVATIHHAAWEEHCLTVREADGRDPCDSMAAAARFLEREDAAVVRQDIFGVRAGSHGWTLATAKPNGVAWPITRLQGGNRGGASLGGTQIIGVTRAAVEAIEVDGHVLGLTCADAYARYCWLGGLCSRDTSTPRAEQARRALEIMEAALHVSGMSFAHVVRTWFFLDHLLEWYDEFNAVRTHFFQERGVFEGVVPASTCVGISSAGGAALVAGALAIQSRSDAVRVRAVTSPLQCPALDYGSSFSRALEIAAPHHRRLLVSGTASIDPDGRTVHRGDARRQIVLTMEIVERLLQSRGMSWSDVSRSVFYVKRAADASLFTEYCRQRGLDCLRPVGVEADVCRDDLLFEIEVDAHRR